MLLIEHLALTIAEVRRQKCIFCGHVDGDPDNSTQKSLRCDGTQRF